MKKVKGKEAIKNKENDYYYVNDERYCYYSLKIYDNLKNKKRIEFFDTKQELLKRKKELEQHNKELKCKVNRINTYMTNINGNSLLNIKEYDNVKEKSVNKLALLPNNSGNIVIPIDYLKNKKRKKNYDYNFLPLLLNDNNRIIENNKDNEKIILDKNINNIIDNNKKLIHRKKQQQLLDHLYEININDNINDNHIYNKDSNDKMNQNMNMINK